MMFYRRYEDEEGAFVNAKGVRYSIQAVRNIKTREGYNVGFRKFSSLEAALRYWKLTADTEYRPSSTND